MFGILDSNLFSSSHEVVHGIVMVSYIVVAIGSRVSRKTLNSVG